MKPKKVAFLLNEFPLLTETFILNQIVFLIESGIDVHVFSLYPGDFSRLHDQFKGYGLEKKVTFIGLIPKNLINRLREVFCFFSKQNFLTAFVVAIHCINPVHFGLRGLRLTYFLYYIRILQIQQFDLVHAHFGIMGVFFSRFSKIDALKNLPLLVSFHGYDLSPSKLEKYGDLYRKMFRRAKLFTVNSNYTSGILNRIGKEIGQSIRILPMGVDTQLFQSPQLFNRGPLKDLQRFKLAYVGRLIPLKGADKAIDIIEIIVNRYGLKQLELLIIGDGPLRYRLEKFIIEKNLKENIILLGSRSQKEIVEELITTDLFIYPGKKEIETGRAEAQGLVLLEAQSMGVPVVAFDVGGIGESIINNETGLLIPPDDLEGFADSVVTLLLNEEKRKTMSISARKFVKEKFDINILGHQLLGIYQEVLG